MERGDRLSRTASIAYTKGLLNNPGENNCFLNSAVQVLWHLDVFRRSFREISGHFCVGESCIFCALKVIFTQIQYSDEAALPPDALRQALAVTFKDQQRFQLQDMDDAAECLENILNRLHFHFAMNEKDEICSAPHCISHRKFAMEIMEQSICACGATSEPLPFSQLVHYVSVSALCHEAEVLSKKFNGLDQDMFGHLLKRVVNQGNVRTCPGTGCGKKINIQQTLLNCPDVVCIGLNWDSESPELEQIAQLLDCIDPVLRLPEVFPRVVDETAQKVELLLAGGVTYYGKHYSTFFYINKLMTWIYFDDAKVQKCGSEWEKIRDKCCQNHYQPLLLLYVNPHSRPVNTKNAPADVKLVDTKTLLASHETNKPRMNNSNEKRNDRGGSTLAVVHETNSDSVDGRLSSPAGHSTEMEGEVSSGDQKKGKRSIKRLKTIGSNFKRVLSRNRVNSPTSEQNPDPGVLEVEKGSEEPSDKKRNSCDDLIDLRDENVRKDTHVYTSTTRGREADELDSGLGSCSSQASSPATSSVSSVDTTTDDLIDFTSRTFPRQTRANDIQHKLESIIDDAESLLRRSYELEKVDLPLALSLVTGATSRFRLAHDNCPASQATVFLSRLRQRHNLCIERSRHLHRLVTERDDKMRKMQFSQEEKRKLINNQKERDQQVLKQVKKAPTVNGTLPRSSVKDRVQVNEALSMSARSMNDLYQNKSSLVNLESPSASRRSNRGHSAGNIGKTRKGLDEDFREDVNCTQKIKPDALCYSPLHYGKTNGLCTDVERLKLTKEPSPRDRSTTVTHVSTSFIPSRSLPVEQVLATSSVLPNSRSIRCKDSRRYSIYDNMPPSEDTRSKSAILPRSTASSSYPTDPSRRPDTALEESRKSWSTPVYVDPPPYGSSRTSQGLYRSQSGSLLQKFNVPRYSETVEVAEDLLRSCETARNSRRVCDSCRRAYVENNAGSCRACVALNNMLYDLHDNTAAMQY